MKHLKESENLIEIENSTVKPCRLPDDVNSPYLFKEMAKAKKVVLLNKFYNCNVDYHNRFINEIRPEDGTNSFLLHKISELEINLEIALKNIELLQRQLFDHQIKKKKEYLSIDEFCKETSISRPKFKVLLKEGKINGVKRDGKKYLIPSVEVENYFSNL